ncbi:hypothetical protein BGZ49_000913, partial [Haplosporangium sp. Z 27]
MPDISSLSNERQGLCRSAYDSLLVYKFDRSQIVSKKDASVALSCTVNLSSQNISNYLDASFLDSAKSAHVLNLPPSRTAHILEPLLEVLEKNDVKYLQEEVQILRGQYRQVQRQGGLAPLLWEPLLNVVEHVCRLVLRPSFEDHSSEADVVSEWKAIINYLLEGSNVYMKSGECVSGSSKEMKEILDEDFDDFGKFGRKVDLLFHANGQELVNCEFKLAEASNLDIEIQNRKNIRLNRAIMENQKRASDLSLELLYMDFQGWNGSLFALYPYDGIYISKYLRPLEIPRSRAGMKRFLGGDTLELLLFFVDHLKDMSRRLNDEKDEKDEQMAKKKHQRIFDLTSEPPLKERRISRN